MSYIEDYKQILDEMKIAVNVSEGEQEDALMFRIKTDKVSNLMVITRFVKDSPIISVELFDFVKIEDEIFGKVALALNELNARFRFGKFYIDDNGDICFAESCMVDENSAMSEIWNITKMLLEMLDEAYPKIMKSIYA